MKVDDPDDNYSQVIHSIKRNFTLNYKKTHNIVTPLSIWQKRFWDHVIRDEQDLEMHLDYIHWNPIKHGYVKKPEDWSYSSYRGWVEMGVYQPGWGWEDVPDKIRGLDFE